MELTELTPQELTVARLIADSKTNGEICDILCIERRTVERHISRIYSKLAHNGNHPRVSIARMFWEQENNPDRISIEKSHNQVTITIKLE